MGVFTGAPTRGRGAGAVAQRRSAASSKQAGGLQRAPAAGGAQQRRGVCERLAGAEALSEARVDALLGFGAQRGYLPRVVLVGARRERERGAVDDGACVQHGALLGRW